MRSGWPHTGDGQESTPASQGHVPFGPGASWPDQGAHPYAAFNAAGYGDEGYSDPGYQGPAAQDAGIPGTRTVQGFVESVPGQAGYPGFGPTQAGYAQSYPQPQSGYSQPGPSRPAASGPGYAGSSYAAGGQMDMAYPQAAGNFHSSDLYQQPWDYDQPLRYDGEDVSYPAADGLRSTDEGSVRYQQPAYDPAAYNGSDYSMPGIDGPGYDLSGIIGTNDFEAIGYDEPSYGRLSYDDPRYGDNTRFDVPRYDETRLDNRWLPGGDPRREGGPAGSGNSGGHAASRPSSSPAAFDRGLRARSSATRYDMRALVEPGDNTRTRFDVPVLKDETRLDNLRPLTPARGMQGSGMQAAGTAVLAPPAVRPRNWAEDTSLDHFADLDLTDEPVPAAFTRTLDRPAEQQRDDDTAARRAIGRRRGRNGDKRQWMALGAIAVVAAGAIGGVFMKYVFSGPSGPAHQVAAPQSVDGFTRSANLEKQLDVKGEAAKVTASSGGHASSVVSGVYQHGGITPGSNTQIFMFVGGKLSGADPGANVANFEQTYPGAKEVPTGSLGGQAACTETPVNNQNASMCVWFDNDSFGALVSPTMTTAKLASTMDTVRPNLEHVAK